MSTFKEKIYAFLSSELFAGPGEKATNAFEKKIYAAAAGTVCLAMFGMAEEEWTGMYEGYPAYEPDKFGGIFYFLFGIFLFVHAVCVYRNADKE